MTPEEQAQAEAQAEETQKANDFLSKVKIQILMKSTFFSTIMLNSKTTITHSVPTAATDGTDLFFNPTFLLTLTLEQGVGLILHEIMHISLCHPSRRADRTPKRWNHAADYAINNDLDNKGYDLPPGGLIDHEKNMDNLPAESIYKIIEDPEDSNPTPGTGDDILDPADPQATTQRANEILVQAQQQSQLNPKPGEHIPDSLARQIHDFLNPKLEWNVILQNFLTDMVREDHSWNRPNRTFLPDFYLPSQNSPSIKNLTVAVDTSGSISAKEFSEYMTEIEQIRSIFQLERLRLICTDTRIRSDLEISFNDSLLEQELSGGGGTDFKHIFSKLEEDPPTILIFFTDMGVSFNFPVPDFPVIWINTSDSDEAPAEYGETIIVN